MHIAVIIPAFNAAPWLRDCLLSVTGQTHADWSLTVVDDGSTDATFSIAARFDDPRVRVVRQRNQGVSAARNRGLWEALGDDAPDAVLLLDADDWLAPDAMARLSEGLEDAPWAVAAVGAYAQAREDGGVLSARRPPDGCLLERLLVRNLFANGGHMLIRREAIETAGRFREDLAFGEDWEYWTRLALLGEFAAVASRRPVLFVRERAGSACRTMAADPASSAAALAAIYANAGIASRLGSRAMRHLRARAEAEALWVAGREMIRHGRLADGQRWLVRSLREAPSARRLALVGVSWLRAGPFRPYSLAG